MDGLVIVMERQEQYSRQYTIDLLNRVGRRDLADVALRELPDPVDAARLTAWCLQHGLTLDALIDYMGGSP